MRRRFLIPVVILLLSGGWMLRAQAVVSVDPATVVGPVKPMNASNNGPITPVINGPVGPLMEAYKALRLPYARTHDTPLGDEYGGHCIDISEIFPDFDAPVNSPKSYDFTNSDVVLLNMLAAGTKPFYRLGQTIEHQKKKYGIYPPKNDKKWARICEHIIRHSNEGWADGYHMGIEYWEIWNEPDLDDPGDRWKTDPRTWAGTQERFYELYTTASKHLKKCFPDLKIGGPAFANPRKYGPAFLDYVKEKGAPLDFFSHHMYHHKPWRIVEDVNIIRKMLDDRGFEKTESILNEWNYNRSWEETDYYSRRMRPTVKGAAFVAAVMCACQNAPLDMLMYYDLRPNTPWCGPFASDTYDLRPPYYAFYYWAELVDYGTQIRSDCDTGNIYTCAVRSADGKSIRLLVARYHVDDNYNTPRDVTVSLPDGWKVTGLRITDGEGQDRSAVPATTVSMASNANALFEIEKQ
ncbi:MAG: hypothetical protein J6X25_06860 [Bacteroidales bacterium]|nr:hypothetical protein [Bacteroidales bacterium]